MENELSSIQQFLQITPNLFTAGQPYEEQFAFIRNSGCQVLINLSAPTAWDYLPEERAIVTALGMAYVPIPVEWTAPQPQDLQAFFAAMRQHAGRQVFVHCARNMRVSAFVYLYRTLILNEPRELCLIDLHRIWQPDSIWQNFIDQQTKSLINP